MSCFPKDKQMETMQQKCYEQQLVEKISSFSLRLEGSKEANADVFEGVSVSDFHITEWNQQLFPHVILTANYSHSTIGT